MSLILPFLPKLFPAPSAWSLLALSTAGQSCSWLCWQVLHAQFHLKDPLCRVWMGRLSVIYQNHLFALAHTGSFLLVLGLFAPPWQVQVSSPWLWFGAGINNPGIEGCAPFSCCTLGISPGNGRGVITGVGDGIQTFRVVFLQQFGSDLNFYSCLCLLQVWPVPPFTHHLFMKSQKNDRGQTPGLSRCFLSLSQPFSLDFGALVIPQ